MSTVTAVRKDGYVAIAADTMVKFGYQKETAKYLIDQKIIQVGASFIGIVGSASVAQAINDYLSGFDDGLAFQDTNSIFKTWLDLHEALKEKYFLNPHADEDDKVESTRNQALIANSFGIFGVSNYRAVFEYRRFYAYGSGSEYALGAMFALYEDERYTAEEIAEAGVRAGAEFDDGTDAPIIVHTVKLHSSNEKLLL